MSPRYCAVADEQAVSKGPGMEEERRGQCNGKGGESVARGARARTRGPAPPKNKGSSGSLGGPRSPPQKRSSFTPGPARARGLAGSVRPSMAGHRRRRRRHHLTGCGCVATVRMAIRSVGFSMRCSASDRGACGRPRGGGPLQWRTNCRRVSLLTRGAILSSERAGWREDDHKHNTRVLR